MTFWQPIFLTVFIIAIFVFVVAICGERREGRQKPPGEVLFQHRPGEEPVDMRLREIREALRGEKRAKEDAAACARIYGTNADKDTKRIGAGNCFDCGLWGNAHEDRLHAPSGFCPILNDRTERGETCAHWMAVPPGETK